MAASHLVQEKIWLDKSIYNRAECLHYEKASKLGAFSKMFNLNMDPCLPKSNNYASTERESLLNINSRTKSKSKKSRDNKVSGKLFNEFIDNSKNLNKNTVSNKKRDALTSKKRRNTADELIVPDIISHDLFTGEIKHKEIKEKKNEANKESRNKEDVNNSYQECKKGLVYEVKQQSTFTPSGSLANEVAKARQHIKESLQCMEGIASMAGVTSSQEISSRLTSLEKENQDLKKTVQELKILVEKLDKRVQCLEKAKPEAVVYTVKTATTPLVATAQKDDNDDVDLFGSDSEGEDAEAAKIRGERLAAYNAKKSKKPALIAKSNIILDVKPWDDETDMKLLEAEVRKIQCDGLLWGAAKLVPLAYGIHKLQISCVVEDDKVSIDWLTEEIQGKEDYVQSVDIAAFNKV